MEEAAAMMEAIHLMAKAALARPLDRAESPIMMVVMVDLHGSTMKQDHASKFFSLSAM